MHTMDVEVTAKRTFKSWFNDNVVAPFNRFVAFFTKWFMSFVAVSMLMVIGYLVEETKELRERLAWFNSRELSVVIFGKYGQGEKPEVVYRLMSDESCRTMQLADKAARTANPENAKTDRGYIVYDCWTMHDMINGEKK